MAASSSTLRVGLLMCGHVDPRAQSIAGDYPELFAALFASHDVELVRYDADQGKLPGTPGECDGWITSPSRSSAFADDPWVREMVTLVALLVAEERPFAGICFGHQLLAQALGGRVERAAAGWGVGAHQYEVVSRRAWMEPWPADGRFRLLASHEDQVTMLPPQAELLATSSFCPNAMMAIGDHAIGLQPHPEFVAPVSAKLLDLREEMIGATTVARARATLDQPLDQPAVADWLYNFLAGRR